MNPNSCYLYPRLHFKRTRETVDTPLYLNCIMTSSAPSIPRSLISPLPLPLRLPGNPTSPPPSTVRFRPLCIASANASAEKTRSFDTCLGAPKLASSSSLYQLLGITTGATGEEIKAAYRRLARSCHPDVVTIGRKDHPSADEFIKIHAAYSTLSDPKKRADYDRRIFRLHRSRSSAPEPVFSRFTGRRNWETDQCW